MNVFDDLIDELKAENLLETSDAGPVLPVKESDAADDDTASILKELAELDESSPALTTNAVVEGQIPQTELPDAQTPVDERDFFRKRAMDEVSSLQMVEHVISGIEREHLKIVPVAFDDLEVKKALHLYIKVADLNSPEHSELEYKLLKETEGWSTALGERDKEISVANVRRFCENSRPVLSSQALMSLARFYRNSPYSEAVRGKFDFVMTRLFSRDIEGEKRKLLFSYDDMVGHIKSLYASWSSILIYSPEENGSEIALNVSRFQDLIIEAESAESFDELLEVDFFNKIRLFKEDTAEMFYVPEVSAAAMECNVRVGNKYVDLIFHEKAKNSVASIEQKYGYSYDQIISNSAAKTFSLINLLRASEAHDETIEAGASFDEVFPDHRPALIESKKKDGRSARFELFGVNKWFLVFAVVLILASVGLYFWAENASNSETATLAATNIDLGTSEIKQHLRTARGSDEDFYGLLQPTWDTMTEAEQKEFLNKVLKFSVEKGFKRVILINDRGRTVGFASKEKLEVYRS